LGTKVPTLRFKNNFSLLSFPVGLELFLDLHSGASYIYKYIYIDILMSTAHMWSSSKWLLSAKFGAAFDRMSLEIILKSLLFSLINLWGSKRNEFSVSAVRFLDFGRCEECSG